MNVNRHSLHALGKCFVKCREAKSAASQVFNAADLRHYSYLPSKPCVAKCNAYKVSSKSRVTLNPHTLQSHTPPVLTQTRPRTSALKKPASVKKSMKALRMKHYKNINDIFQCCAHPGNLDRLDASEIARLWSFIPKNIGKTRKIHPAKGRCSHAPTHRQVENRAHWLNTTTKIMERTIQVLPDCTEEELADIVVYLGDLMLELKEAGRQSSVNHFAFRDLLFDNEHIDKTMNHAEYRDLLVANDKFNEMWFEPFAAAVSERLSMFHLRDLGRVANGYATMEKDPTFDDDMTLFGKMAAETMRRLDEFDPKNIVSIMQAFSRMKHSSTNEVLFQTVGDSILEKDHLNKYRSQTVAFLASAYAASQVTHPRLFDKIADSVCNRDDMDTFKPIHLAQILASFATLNQKHSAMFKAIGDCIFQMDDLGTKKCQPHLSNILWAYAKLQETHPALFVKIGEAILSMKFMADFTSEDLSTIVWAYATDYERNGSKWRDESCQQLFQRIGDTLSTRDLRIYNPKSLANVLWAYATTSYTHPELFKKMGDTIDDMGDVTLFDCKNILWAFETLHESHLCLDEMRRYSNSKMVE